MSYPLPYVQPVTLTDGKVFTVEGVISPQAKRFTIGFAKGRDFGSDTVLIIDVRFQEKAIVRNHCLDSKWGTEERHGGIPCNVGGDVEVKIEVKGNEFQIFINKAHFCDFKTRIPKEVAQNFIVSGDITVRKISTPDSGSHDQHNSQHNEHHNPPVPLTIPVSSLHSGRKIVVCGVPTGGQRFSVLLLCGPNIDHDVAFLIDARFNFGDSHNVVVRNNKSGGSWGSEDRGNGFPFSVNTEFEIVIKVKGDEFKVIVNDEKFCSFPYRIRPDRVTHLSVTGDVRLNHVKV